MQRHKMEISTATKVSSLLVQETYSDNGTLSPRSLQHLPMNHCVQNTTPRRAVFEMLRNSKIIFLIIVSLKSGMENSIIQELNAEADKIIGNTLLPAKSRQRYEQVYKRFIELPYFVKHFKFVSWLGLCPWTPPGLRPGPPYLPPPLVPPPPRLRPACQQAALTLKNDIPHTYFVEPRSTRFEK